MKASRFVARCVVCALVALCLTPALGACAAPSGVLLFNAHDAKWSEGGGPGSTRTPIIGDPSAPGAYLHLIRIPQNTVSKAHRYSDGRAYTVIAGTWYVGFGDHYDAARLIALPPGSYYWIPAGTAVYNATRADGATIQIRGTGPSEHSELEAVD